MKSLSIGIDTNILIVPLTDQVCLVSEQVDVPVKGLEVADEVVLDVTRSAFLIERSPVLVIVPQISVQNVIQKLGKPESKYDHKICRLHYSDLGYLKVGPVIFSLR